MADEKASEVAAWLQRAAEDVRGAEVDLAAAPPLVGDALSLARRVIDATRSRLARVLGDTP